ncbi:MAG: TVP38/TMEM64 family protein [Selenomonadaceae bacterium]|nr:TVP38/TMEM64 family protein [Selenomonadaceae bacterium]
MRLRSETTVKCTALILLFLLFGGVWLLFPDVCARLWHIMTCGSMQETIDYIQSFGVWAMLFSFCLDVLVNALGFLPSIFISTANGVLFGVVPGIIVSWLAETTGVILSFLLMRTILRDSAEKVIRKSPYLSKLDEFSGKKGFQMMLIARTIPYFPSGILTALGAVSRISVKDYMLSNLIGKFPSTALEVVIGHDAVLFHEHMERLTCVVVLATIVYAAIWYVQRKRSTKTDAEDN